MEASVEVVEGSMETVEVSMETAEASMETSGDVHQKKTIPSSGQDPNSSSFSTGINLTTKFPPISA